MQREESPRIRIVATIGPASWSVPTLHQMILAGMDVARLNMSHGDHITHRRIAGAVREAAAQAGRSVKLLVDLQGAKLRIGDVGDGVPLAAGEEVRLVAGARVAGGEREIPVPNAVLELVPGDTVLLDDGKIELSVERAEPPHAVICRVVVGGTLTSFKGINLPTRAGRASANGTAGLTLKDERDLQLAVELGADWVALSYVRHPNEIFAVRTLLAELVPHRRPPRLMAKIETPEAVRHVDAIIAAADGIMVARGDLGLEMPAEDVPLIQKMVIRRCNRAGKPVVTATQMLESMCLQPRPTRAEVSDVVNAILDGTDGVMLSGETATGSYPVKAVETMRRIIERVEAEQRAPVFTEPSQFAHPARASRRHRLDDWLTRPA